VADPLCPSLVAVIVAAPAISPVASPVPDTVATGSALELQVTTRPLSKFPLASFRVAVNCWVPPTVTLTLAGLTATDATGAGDGGAIVTAALPLIVPLGSVAVTCDVPAV